MEVNRVCNIIKELEAISKDLELSKLSLITKLNFLLLKERIYHELEDLKNTEEKILHKEYAKKRLRRKQFERQIEKY